MRKYIGYIILIILMLACFFMSGLFFINTGIMDFQTGNINEEQAVTALAELNKLPLIKIDAYNITFHSVGKAVEINKDSAIIFLPSHRKNQTFAHSLNISEFNKTNNIKIYYNYLPEGGKKIIRIQNIPDRNIFSL